MSHSEYWCACGPIALLTGRHYLSKTEWGGDLCQRCDKLHRVDQYSTTPRYAKRAATSSQSPRISRGADGVSVGSAHASAGG